ncbi:MAG: nitroreductase family deazaflavin-dependent oxidoreductase, partial [Acidimicrobiales bacterium]|nr:nitroreductase family deazaflavin-dependent oxidoreductase [Acidimicrobiales bacterium]
MPSDGFLKAMNAGHRALMKVSFGKLGWKMGPMPVLELTTVGRKSGQPRSVMLTSPIQRGDEVVIVASKGGEDTHPAWYLNLVDQPRVQVALGGAPAAPYDARVATPEERAEMWPTIT